MATIVNDRDVQIEATSPRVAGVSLAPNIVVDPTNVTGLGLVIAASKGVSLAATSQIFQIPKSGSISPASITLTATVANLVTIPTLTIASGGGTMSVTPALTSGSFTFNASQMTTDTVTLLLSVTENSITYHDTMTFVKCREGIDSVNVILSNQDVSLPADYLGNVLNYGTAAGTIKVYQGINDVTSVCTFSVPAGGNPDSLTYSLVAGPSGTGGQYALTGGFGTSLDNSSLKFRVTFGTVTVDSLFTVSKTKAGQAGTNGTSGTNGSRGSVTLYVALAGTTAVWSDTTATSNILSTTGTAPHILDVVTEYNNSQSFSVTKFYDGSAWQVVNAVINGNLLVDGTVAGNALVANTVTAGKIDSRGLSIKDASGNVILGVGTQLPNAYLPQSALNNLVDPSWWQVGVVPSGRWSVNATGPGGSNSLVLGQGPSGNSEVLWKAIAGTGGVGEGGWDNSAVGGGNYFIADTTKTYRFVVPMFRAAGADGTVFWGPQGSTVNDLNTGTIEPNPYFISGASPSTGKWFLFVGYVYPYGSASNTNAGAGMYDMTTGQLVVAGNNYQWAAPTSINTSCRAYQYYSSAGSVTYFDKPQVCVVDGSETPLAALLATGAVSARNPLNSGNVSTYIAAAAIGSAQVGTLVAGNIDTRGLTIKDGNGNIILSAGTQLGNDDANNMGFNPLFNAWTGTYPNNWLGWTGALPVRVTSGLPNTPFVVQYTVAGDTGITSTYQPGGPPLPAGSFLTGTFSAYVGTNNGGGPPGYLVRVYTNAGLTTYVDTTSPIPDQRASGWQHWAFTAGAGGAPIYAIQIYQMAAWVGMPASAAGVAGAFANGSIVSFGPMSFTANLPITAGNASTYIAALAIGSAQISDLRTTNYAEDGSGNPTAGAKLASTGTALKVASGSLQVGSAVFTDYWYRLVNAIDGSQGSNVIWRGNNDTTTRGGAPNASCIAMYPMQAVVANGVQWAEWRYTITPTSYNASTDNLDGMQAIRMRLYATTGSATPFVDAHYPCMSRLYDGGSGVGNGRISTFWRNTNGGVFLESSDHLYDGYIRLNLINLYGPSADRDFGRPTSGYNVALGSASITGASSGGGGGSSGGGGCPAPWVKVALLGGRKVDASDLFDGAVVEAVNDNDLSPLPKGGIVRRPQIIWKQRIALTLTNGQKTEWSIGHRFCLMGGEWVNIESLKPGDHIMGPVENIVQSIVPTGEGPVVTFQVEGAGTYFSADMLSHNWKNIP